MSASTPWILQDLPVPADIETRKILKSLPSAHAALAELKVTAATIPDPNILVNTLGLQEAKDSSAIENIITTHDDLYKANINPEFVASASAKEVQHYIAAARKGYTLLKERDILTNNLVIAIQETLENNMAGFRKLPGTTLKNANTGEIIYTPPQHPDEIIRLMNNLEAYINTPEADDLDPIVKMAIIHFQFESIHPFYDGNGRTGRIINILFLILTGLQSFPILYLSNYIIRHKNDYYRLLQNVRQQSAWEDWILFMIKGVEQTAKETVTLIQGIKSLMDDYKITFKTNYKFFSHKLLNNLFKHPYTKIEFIEKDLGVSRITAANYLNKLAEDGILEKKKLGTGNYYINKALFALLSAR